MSHPSFTSMSTATRAAIAEAAHRAAALSFDCQNPFMAEHPNPVTWWAQSGHHYWDQWVRENHGDERDVFSESYAAEVERLLAAAEHAR